MYIYGRKHGLFTKAQAYKAASFALRYHLAAQLTVPSRGTLGRLRKALAALSFDSAAYNTEGVSPWLHTQLQSLSVHPRTLRVSALIKPALSLWNRVLGWGGGGEGKKGDLGPIINRCRQPGPSALWPSRPQTDAGWFGLPIASWACGPAP